MLTTHASARGLGTVAAMTLGLGCGRLPSELPTPAVVWIVDAPLIVLDSVSLRPVGQDASRSSAVTDRSIAKEFGTNISRASMVTTYQGSRYHAESIRAITDDREVMAAMAGSVARAAGGEVNGLLIDFQGATPDDLPRLVEIVRAIADSAHARRISPIGMVVPPGDTVAYPTAILARVADLIVVRLHGEHKPGTAPGPLASQDWISRQLGMRAVEVGVKRLVAELPLFGYRWDASGSARPITFEEARSLVLAESGSFRRDPATSFLSAAGRDGWTVWVPDARTIETMIAAVRRSGVSRLALSGTSGADPEIWQRLPAAIRR